MFFFQPLDQFDLYLVNSFVFNQFFFFDFFKNFLLGFNFVGLIFFTLVLFSVFFLFTLPVFYNRLRVVPLTI